jgi:hypothetical protein
MKVKQLISKLQTINQDIEIMLHDGFSVNAIEIETVIFDKSQDIVIITPQEVDFDDLGDSAEIL